MLTEMLKEMFNEKEQQMLEYMASHYLSSYFEYHQQIGSTKLLHFPTKISANELARIFKINEEDAKDFFGQLEKKSIGKISIYKSKYIDSKNVNNITLHFYEIGEETENRHDKNTEWMFDFNEKVLQSEIIKPTVDEWKNAIIRAVNK